MIETVEFDKKTKLWWTYDERGRKVKSYSTKRHALNALLKDVRENKDVLDDDSNEDV